MNRYICQDFYNESLRIAFRKWWVGPRIDINQEIAKRIYAEPETNRFCFTSPGNMGPYSRFYMMRHHNNYADLLRGGLYSYREIIF